MTVALTETGPWGSESGTSDHVFVQRLRELLRDYPVGANEQADGNGLSTNLQMQKVPINDDDYLMVTVNNALVPLVSQRSQIASSNCWMDFNSGMLVFGTAPPVGVKNIAIQKQRVRWTTSVLLQSLQGGLRQIFPVFGKLAADTSITLQVLKWSYPLPQDFLDPRVKIIGVEVQEVPSSVNRFIPISGFRRVGLNDIEIPTSQRYTPGATLRIEYKAPYRSLSELEPQAYDLPLWYAAGQLLGFDEARRTRMDTQTPAAEQQANPPGYLQNSGSWYMTQFRTFMAQFPVVTKMPRPISTYEF
jgi:hypothetical protein